MKRAVLIAAGAVLVPTAVFAGLALGSTGAKKSSVAIKMRISSGQDSSGHHNGTFQLLLDRVALDSGRSSILPFVVQARTVDGQEQSPVTGYDSLTGKKGTLSLAFRGVVIGVNTNAAGESYSVEYGTWTINGATGKYKGWTGHGRWADAGTPKWDNIEWDGIVTH
jgi:hypothetical protein